RNIRLSFQRQHRLAQRTFIQPHRPCTRKRQRLATPIAKIRFFIREDPCFLPTRLTRNSESSLLDTFTADYTDLRICNREDRIVDQFTSTREVHTKKKASPNPRRPQIISNQ